MRFRDTLPLWFALALAALLANAYVSHRNIERLVESQGWVAHTHEVQDALAEVLSTLKDAETGQRGYVITGDARYLGPYEAALSELPDRVERLKQLTADNASQQQHLVELERLAGTRLQELQRVMALRRDSGFEAARDRVAGDRGRSLMDELRELVRSMSADEDRLLREREADARQQIRLARVTNVVGVILGSCMVVVAFFLFQRDSRAREHQKQNLEREVVERTAALTRTNADLVGEIAERRRAEEQARAFAEELGRSNGELQQFASVASHDLQEPLRKIQAFGDRLQTKCAAELGEQGRDYLSRVQESAGRMRTLINDLLTFSRIKTKAQPHARVDLKRLADEVVGDLDGRLQQTGGRVAVGELPVVVAEPLQMRQLLQNLIGNALKFQKPGEPPVVEVRGRVRSDPPSASGNGTPSADGPRVEVAVSDNGIGFDEKYLDRIFDVFQRLHGRNEYEGTGMGLAICRRIVEQHGGTITARSRPNEGSTFIVTLPVPRDSPEEHP